MLTKKMFDEAFTDTSKKYDYSIDHCFGLINSLANSYGCKLLILDSCHNIYLGLCNQNKTLFDIAYVNFPNCILRDDLLCSWSYQNSIYDVLKTLKAYDNGIKESIYFAYSNENWHVFDYMDDKSLIRYIKKEYNKAESQRFEQWTKYAKHNQIYNVHDIHIKKILLPANRYGIKTINPERILNIYDYDRTIKYLHDNFGEDEVVKFKIWLDRYEKERDTYHCSDNNTIILKSKFELSF